MDRSLEYDAIKEIIKYLSGTPERVLITLVNVFGRMVNSNDM